MTSDDLPRKVWYCLMTPSGDAFSKMAAASLTLAPSTTAIDQFRMLVKSRHANTLNHADPSQLKVYRNKASLEKTNNSSRDKKRSRLDASSSHELQDKLQPTAVLSSSLTLTGLGKGYTDDAVIAVVAPGVLDGTFVPCSDPFFAELLRIKEQNDWLDFKSRVPCTMSHKLYIRSAYKVIADGILSGKRVCGIQHVLLSGTPGVGKSVFLNYFIWRLIQVQQRMFFLTDTPKRYFDGHKMWDCKKMPRAGQFWTRDLWCLVDSCDPTLIDDFPYMRCSTLLSSLPREDHMYRFCNLAPTPNHFFMPCWTEQELEAIASLSPPAEDVWRHRFEHLGGVPRHIFQDLDQEPTTTLKNLCVTCPLKDCLIRVNIPHSKDSLPHRLIHIHSVPPYRTCGSKFASKIAMHMIARTHWTRVKAGISQLLQTSACHSLANPLGAYVFELHALSYLEKGGSFQYRELFADEVPTLATATIQINSRGPREMVKSMAEGQVVDQLYVSSVPKSAGMDAWIPNVGGFQMAAMGNYSIDSDISNILAELHSNGENCLYFLVPPLYFDEMVKITTDSQQPVVQYALCIPCPAADSIGSIFHDEYTLM